MKVRDFYDLPIHDRIGVLLSKLSTSLMVKSFYIQAPLLLSTTRGEGYIHRQANGLWRIGKVVDYGKAQVFSCVNRPEDVLEIITLGEYPMDLTSLEAQLKGKVLEQAAYADLILTEIGELLGQQVVNKAIEDHKAFGKRLVGMVGKLLGGGKNRGLTLVGKDKNK